ncbi:hypothetical protein AB0L40_03750 [Patulibacter sp. NPDC049589]|uniref:hypothetical protein n=1 Tax=Patulibacter sp. NPDC049589 TaxID=3154731 RepID=UPI0034438564
MPDFLYLPSFRWSETTTEPSPGGGIDLRVPLDPGDLTDVQVEILRSRIGREFPVAEVLVEHGPLGARFLLLGLALQPDDAAELRTFQRAATAVLDGVQQDALVGWSAGDEIVEAFMRSPEGGGL